MKIAEYFESVKDRTLTDSFVVNFKVTKQVNRSNNGHLRARITFIDNSILEFSEFIEQASEDEIRLVTYSYHWESKNGDLIRRWDNARHFPRLENFPHHIHDGKTGDVTPGKLVNIFQVLDEIASNLDE